MPPGILISKNGPQDIDGNEINQMIELHIVMKQNINKPLRELKDSRTKQIMNWSDQ